MHNSKDEFPVPSAPPVHKMHQSQLPPCYPMVSEFVAPPAPMQVPPPIYQQPPHYPKADEFTEPPASMRVTPPSHVPLYYPRAKEFAVPPAPMQGSYAPLATLMQMPPSSLQPQPQVAIGVPAIGVPPRQYQVPGTWTTGLCDCFDDFDSCCLTFWCPCITFGRVAHITSKGSSSCAGSSMMWCFLLFLGLYITAYGWQWMYSCSSRSNLRAQYNLPEDPCCDCCVHFCFESCSLCQIYRELQNRGFDMSLGYQANVERINRAALQAPQVPGGMIRNNKNNQHTTLIV